MKNLPEISSYGEYSSDNYGVNALKVTFDEFTLYYSYQTIVAYRDWQDGLVMCRNTWGPTTGKHLNFLSENKENRLQREDFEQMLKAMLNRHMKE